MVTSINMLTKSVSWIIAIIVSSKSLALSYEFSAFNLKNMLPNLNSNFITKPIQSLYHAPLSAVNLLQQTNPFNYLMPYSEPQQKSTGDQNTTYSQNYTTLNSPGTSNHMMVTKAPNMENVFGTSLAYDNQVVNSVQNYPASKTIVTPIPQSPTKLKYDMLNLAPKMDVIFDHFLQVLEQLDRKFYQVSFSKLLSISPPDRHENGISFAQSGFFLYLQLMALCTESDEETVMQIKESLGLNTTCAEQVQLLSHIMSNLPESNDFLKFRWSSRFVLGPQVLIGENFVHYTAPALHIHLDHLNKTDPPGELTKRLNQMVEADSGGAMHDTFDEEELSNGVCAAWLTTLFLRARWRSAPTALNGSWVFYDGTAPTRSVRMIRINDVMRYAHIDAWDAEVIEIRYAAPEVTFMILMPRGRSLRNLSKKISTETLRDVYEKLRSRRIAVILPIYTLRMTLLMPGKLDMMRLSRLVDSQAGSGCQSLKLSHAVQRIMFWAEAGRNAFKDDGIEWDEAPEMERIVDRPYIFFVRWRNLTLLSGNFVL